MRNRVMARAATDETLQLFALAPVCRGEGGVRGTAAEFHPTPATIAAADPSP